MKVQIALWPYQKSSKWYRTMISKLICFFTNGNYTHSVIAIDEYIYESQVMNHSSGALKTKRDVSNKVCLELVPPLTTSQAEQLKYILELKVSQRRPYNFMKIAVLMFVYPTRKFWNWINWVPFQNEVYGSVCSVFVDEAFKEIGIDLLEDDNEEYTSPSDFIKSNKLKMVVKP